MSKARILTAREAADLINDGDVVTISSSSGLNCPDAVLAGIGERFSETASPRNLTTMHPIGSGDMWGIKGVDHLARPGLLARIIAGSVPSGPSSVDPPLIWQMIENEEIQAYNFPSGVIFQMHRAAATHQPGVFTKVGLDTFIDPRQEAGRMNESTPRAIVELAELKGEEWLFFETQVPNVAIIRGTTADENGNLTFEDEASPLGALDLAYAAHNNGGLVIAQVKRLAEAGSLAPQNVRVPGVLVDAIVIVPDQMQATQTQYDPSISGQLRRPLSTLKPVEFSLEKLMARRAAMELQSGEIANLGFGVSALVPHVLVEEQLAKDVNWIIEQGSIGGVPLLEFVFGVAQNPDAIMPSIDQFTFLQGGGFQHSLLSFMQVDAAGSVNVHSLPRRRHVTAGVGGFADITSRAPSIMFLGSFTAGKRDIRIEDGRLNIVSDGPFTKFVPKLTGTTFSGRRAVANGQEIIYITERAVLKLTAEGLVVTEIAAGVDLEKDVLAKSDIELIVSPELRLMDSRIFRPALMGLKLSKVAEHPRMQQLGR